MKTTSVYHFNQPEGVDNILASINAINTNFNIIDTFDTIIEKNIGQIGYIKYKSGLIMQWGHAVTGADTQRGNIWFSQVTVTFPVAFQTVVFFSNIMSASTVNGWPSRAWDTLTQCTYDLTGNDECTNGRAVKWFAIGI